MSNELIRVRRDGAVAVVRYDNPPRNFLTLGVLSELRRCWAALERDPEVHVIVFAGASDGHFMLHTEVAQIRAMLASTPPLPGPIMRLAIAAMRGVAWMLSRWPWMADRVLSARSEQAMVRSAVLEMTVLFDMIERSSKVTIAAINGSCIGGGLELALCFDQRIVLDDPDLRIGCPEVLIGLLPGFGGTQRLVRLLGASRALDILLGGELLTARAAAEMGLASQAHSPDEFWPSVDELASRLARRPTNAVAAIKRAIRRGGQRSLGRGLALELREVSRVARTSETRESLDAYAREIERQIALPEAQQLGLVMLAERMAGRRQITRVCDQLVCTPAGSVRSGANSSNTVSAITASTPSSNSPAVGTASHDSDSFATSVPPRPGAERATSIQNIE